MKIKEGFMLRNFLNRYVAVEVSGGSDYDNTLINMNESGAFVWELLQENISYESALNKITDKYDITEKAAKADLDEFLDKLRKANLLVE